MHLGILKLSHLGDIVHSLPLVYIIKKERYNFQINFILEKKCFDIFKPLSFIDNFLPFDFSLESFKNLRSLNLDLIFDLQGLYKTSIISFFSNSCKRIGFNFKNLKEPFLFFLYHKKIKPSGKHIIEKNLSFAKYLGINDFDFSNYSLNEICLDPKQKVQKFLNSLQNENFIIFHPFSSKKEKYFPINPLKNLTEILKERKIQILLTYGPGEEREAEEISKNLKIIKTPLFNINEKAYLIKKSLLFIGPDTGLLHFADSLRVKTIGYYKIYPPERNGAYFEKSLSFYKKEVDFKEIIKFLEENCSFF